MNPHSHMAQLLLEVTLAEVLDNSYIMLPFILMIKLLAFYFFFILKIKQYAFEKDFLRDRIHHFAEMQGVKHVLDASVHAEQTMSFCALPHVGSKWDCTPG